MQNQFLFVVGMFKETQKIEWHHLCVCPGSQRWFWNLPQKQHKQPSGRSRLFCCSTRSTPVTTSQPTPASASHHKGELWPRVLTSSSSTDGASANPQIPSESQTCSQTFLWLPACLQRCVRPHHRHRCWFLRCSRPAPPAPGSSCQYVEG